MFGDRDATKTRSMCGSSFLENGTSLLTVSGDRVAFEKAEAFLILKGWYFARYKLHGEFRRPVRSIMYVSGGFVQRVAAHSCSGLDLRISGI